MSSICVFCSSSDAVDDVYRRATCELGAQMAVRGHELVYGGTNVGLMGALADSVLACGGRIVGVLPKVILPLRHPRLDVCIETPDLRTRKAEMDARSDAFIALPGGFGTLEEVLEVLTLKQLGVHSRAVVFLNTRGFYDGLQRFFEQLYEQRFARTEFRQLYHFADSPEDALHTIESHVAKPTPPKWFDRQESA